MGFTLVSLRKLDFEFIAYPVRLTPIAAICRAKTMTMVAYGVVKFRFYVKK
jgi:hypothetical protein